MNQMARNSGYFLWMVQWTNAFRWYGRLRLHFWKSIYPWKEFRDRIDPWKRMIAVVDLVRMQSGALWLWTCALEGVWLVPLARNTPTGENPVKAVIKNWARGKSLTWTSNFSSKILFIHSPFNLDNNLTTIWNACRATRNIFPH